MKIDVPAEDYEELERAIADPSSPVGIDAKRTHVLILYKLRELERRLDSIERRLER